MKINSRYRNTVKGKDLFVCIHEWGGYETNRIKKLKNGKSFECGLDEQINRFSNSHCRKNIDVTITLSEMRSENVSVIQHKANRILYVDNISFDFSGYNTFYESIKNRANNYVILTNSSVSSLHEDFLDGYIEYMENNLDVAILGTSYNTKCYQSLIRNNFHPHLQSFFLFTTTEVLNDIVSRNQGKFPGYGISHKLLLIRDGEIKISEIALKLGYSLAVVLEDGSVFKFKKTHKFDNCYKQWSNLPKGDMRLHIKNPNKINPIKKKECL